MGFWSNNKDKRVKRNGMLEADLEMSASRLSIDT